jgi:hypothetical protein
MMIRLHPTSSPSICPTTMQRQSVEVTARTLHPAAKPMRAYVKRQLRQRNTLMKNLARYDSGDEFQRVDQWQNVGQVGDRFETLNTAIISKLR